MNARLKHPRWKNGYYSNSAVAKRMIERGMGLSEKQIEEFIARVNAARDRKTCKR